MKLYKFHFLLLSRMIISKREKKNNVEKIFLKMFSTKERHLAINILFSRSNFQTSYKQTFRNTYNGILLTSQGAGCVQKRTRVIYIHKMFHE